MTALIKEFALITLLITASPALLVFHASAWADNESNTVSIETMLEQ